MGLGLGARNVLIRNRNVSWGCVGCRPLLQLNRNQIGKMITRIWNPLKMWNFFDEVWQTEAQKWRKRSYCHWKCTFFFFFETRSTTLTFTNICLHFIPNYLLSIKTPLANFPGRPVCQWFLMCTAEHVVYLCDLSDLLIYDNYFGKFSKRQKCPDNRFLTPQ